MDIGQVQHRKGIAPRQSERLKERFGSDPGSIHMRALVQAAETSEDLKSGKPLFTLTLELRQVRETGEWVSTLLRGSGNVPFDAFVLETWPKAIASAGAPPPEAFRGSELRSIWAVEGWLRNPKKLEETLSYLPSPGVMGLPVDRLMPKLSQEGYRYEFRARLLRVY